MARARGSSWWVALVLLLAAPVFAAPNASFGQQLGEADGLRSSDPARFATLLDGLDARRAEAKPGELQRLQYLRAYQSVVYRNDLARGIEQAKSLFHAADDADLRFRAGSLLVNTYAINRNFSEGLRYLNRALPTRFRVKDRELRHDGINSASVFYNQLGQYKLGLQYAEEVLADRPNPRSGCIAGLHRRDAQLHLGLLPADDAAVLRDIDRCVAIGEKMAANFLRVVLARKWVARGESDQAIALLETHLPEVEAIGYHRLIAEAHSLLAELKLAKNDLEGAQAHAAATISRAEHLASSIFLATAYRVLYRIDERRADLPAMLEHYRLYAEADKAHLTDVKARELAYEIVRHEALQKNQQIELLERQNEVLQLQQSLDAEAAKNTRLLVVLLTFLLTAIGYWAYRVKRRQTTLRRLAETDALTGVSNRHHFTAQSEHTIVRCAQDGEPVALVMFDLDHFKAINDSYGHVTGDWVLKEVAETCRTLCRRIDHLGRLGGEEFAILLHGVDLHAATRLAEDCRVRIARIDTRDSGHAFAITASFGVSASSMSGYDLSRLLSHADLMLYRAKREGRNRVFAYSGADAPIIPAANVVTPITGDKPLRSVGS